MIIWLSLLVPLVAAAALRIFGCRLTWLEFYVLMAVPLIMVLTSKLLVNVPRIMDYFVADPPFWAVVTTFGVTGAITAVYVVKSIGNANDPGQIGSVEARKDKRS